MNPQNEKARATGESGHGPNENRSQAHYATNPIDKILPLLDGVKQTGEGRWLARCPAHEDKHPSFSVREKSDGTLVLRCYAGCENIDIVHAIGLTFRDLFPQTHGKDFDPTAPKINPPRFRAAELLEIAAFESRIVAIAVLDIAGGKPLNDADADRVVRAADTLSEIVREVGHG